MKCTWTIFLVTLKTICSIEHDFKGFDDSILFGINWPGSDLDENVPDIENFVDSQPQKPESKDLEKLRVTTSLKETYECHLPDIKPKSSSGIEDYRGPDPVSLLNPLFAQKICSYRLESYWSYEVCHGRYVRQYHEEREGKVVKSQEFFLGNWNVLKQLNLEANSKIAQASKEKPDTTKVEGMTLPYVELDMDDGTLCDLSGKPRVTRVRYVCYSHGKHEIYSFKETSTCEYEIIILSPLLCEHPQFKPVDVSENTINCLAIGDAPKKPRGLLQMEADSVKFNHQTLRLMTNELDKKDILAVLKVEKIDKDGTPHLKFELHPIDADDDSADSVGIEEVEEKPTTPPLEKPPASFHHNSPVRSFLNGETCLEGGTGWWKYEFCFGRHVVQYHVDRIGEKTTLLLGRFDEAAHIEWINQNKAKAPKPLEYRTSISHFYSGGDICDRTGKPRQTEVKLKCLENSSSSTQVTLYLLEPRTCHYILGVETPLICDILPIADENGLIKQTIPLPKKSADVVVKEEGEGSKEQVEVPKIGND